MFRAFFRYFFVYLFRARTRQKLLFFAFVGLALSSFSLLVLQSTMGGLQKNVIERSQEIFGTGEVTFSVPAHVDEIRPLSQRLDQEQIEHNLEYRFEVLIRRGQYLSPAIVHGVFLERPPNFLADSDFREAVIGPELFGKLGGVLGDAIQIISPAHVNPLFRDVPRSTTVYVDDVLRTKVPDVDTFSAWVDINKIHNLIRTPLVNRIRVSSNFDGPVISKAVEQFFPTGNYRVQSWADSHQTLVWALGLETSVMVFLFVAMTILVSLCVVSGLLLFFDKVELDLSSFWILGASKQALERSTQLFFISMAFGAVVTGLGLGLIALYFLDTYGFEILPAVFVDRKIPVDIRPQALAISFLVPLGIGLSFMIWVLRGFSGRTNYLDRVRSVG